MGIETNKIAVVETGYGPYPRELVRAAIPVFLGNTVSLLDVIRFHQAVRSGLLEVSATFPEAVPVAPLLIPDLSKVDAYAHLAAEVEFLELQRSVLAAMKNQFLPARKSRSYKTLRALFEEAEASSDLSDLQRAQTVAQEFNSELQDASAYAEFLETERVALATKQIQEQNLSFQQVRSAELVSLDERRALQKAEETQRQNDEYFERILNTLGAEATSLPPSPQAQEIAPASPKFVIKPKRAAKIIPFAAREPETRAGQSHNSRITKQVG